MKQLDENVDAIAQAHTDKVAAEHRFESELDEAKKTRAALDKTQSAMVCFQQGHPPSQGLQMQQGI
jgi:hypothetical protein